MLKCCPPGRRTKGRPRNSLMQEVTIGMREKKIAKLQAQKDMKTLIICTKINNNKIKLLIMQDLEVIDYKMQG